jgi:GNAT superfamily N-acetyltransferase
MDAVMCIIGEAQAALQNLNIDQWQNNYPAVSDIRKDMDSSGGYVLEDEYGKIIAYCAVYFDIEPTYEQIFDGNWLSNERFVVAHRVAVKQTEKRKGRAEKLFSEIICLAKSHGITSFKIDTHAENIPMQNLLKKNGFSYCGIILLNNGDKRLAFEKMI